MLTKEDKALASNADILLAKNRIIEAVYELFGKLAESYKVQAAGLPSEIIYLHPKIAKGENYWGLPWVMLDYPRLFSGGSTFAIRTFFGWGHHFSLHLLLQGDKMPLLNWNTIPEDGWYCSLASDPWQHHFDAYSNVSASQLMDTMVHSQREKGFYKISSFLPVTQWDETEAFFNQKFIEAIRMIRLNDER